MRAFEGPQLRLMFYKFDDLDNGRLNRGVRGRLIEHCKFLVRENKIKGYDAADIYENTKALAYEDDSSDYYDGTIDMRDSGSGSSSDLDSSSDVDAEAVDPYERYTKKAGEA